MENKLSRGTIIFIWSILFCALFSLGSYLVSLALKISAFPFLSEFASLIYILDGWVTIALGLMVGVFLLRRKEWARKLLLIFVTVGLFTMVGIRVPFLYYPKYKLQVSAVEKQAAEQWQRGFDSGIKENGQGITKEEIERVTEESLPEKSEYVAKKKQTYSFILGIIYAILYGGLAFYNVILLFFFTRPKVKAQFK